MNNSSIEQSKARTTRRRGGQPGNTNAVTHGYYSTTFSDLVQQDADLEAALNLSVTDEIQLSRVQIHRLLTFMQHNPPTSIDTMVAALNAITAANTRIAHMIRLHQSIIAATPDTAAIDLPAALAAALQELQKHD